MRMCQFHWDQLRAAVDERGMSGLIAGDGHKAAEAMDRELAGASEASDFDPLMAANWAIFSRALKMGGLYLMTEDESCNEYCPLCEADAHGGHAANWIQGCMDAQLEHARELKLIPGVQ